MKEIKESIKKVFESKKVSGFLVVLGILVVTSIIFQAGVFVGFHKASFGRDWGENYGRNFGMMGGRGGFDDMMGNFPNAHGTAGKIIKIELPTIIVGDRDNTEKVVLISNDTKIIDVRNDINVNGLKVDENIVVVGSPNSQGQIEAKLIRVMPFSPTFSNSTSTVSPQINNPIKQ